MKNIDLQQIYYFKTVMKCQSFSQAARLAFTTQSTISKNIASLEAEIGEKLFIRRKQGILPTQRALILDLELTDIYEKIDSLFNKKYAEKKEALNIGFCEHINFASIIPQLFSLFSSEGSFQDAEVRLLCKENSNIIEGVLNGSMDLGFILSDTDISNPNIKLYSIYSAVPQIFYSINSPLYNKKELKLEDFADYPLVTTQYLIQQNDYRMINMLPFTPSRIEIVDSYSEISLYLATGKYITVLRPCVNLSNNKSIKRYKLPSDYGLSQGINMIYLTGNRNKALKKLLQQLNIST